MVRSAVEKSPHRAEIEKMIIKGESSRSISVWLKELPEDRGPENISHVSINNYKKKYDPVKKAKTKYRKEQRKAKKKEEESQNRLEKAADKVLDNIHFYDQLIENASSLDLDDLNNDKAIEFGLRAAKQKQDLIKDEPPVVLEVKAGELDDDERKLAKAVADYFARQGEDSEESEPER